MFGLAIVCETRVDRERVCVYEKKVVFNSGLFVHPKIVPQEPLSSAMIIAGVITNPDCNYNSRLFLGKCAYWKSKTATSHYFQTTEHVLEVERRL